MLPSHTGYRPPDALDLWAAILSDSPGPRQEVVHQVRAAMGQW